MDLQPKTPEPNPEELEAARDAARLSTVMPIIERRIDHALNSVVNRAASALKREELTPELALSLWMEYLAAKSLLKNMQVQVQVGGNLSIRQEN